MVSIYECGSIKVDVAILLYCVCKLPFPFTGFLQPSCTAIRTINCFVPSLIVCVPTIFSNASGDLGYPSLWDQQVDSPIV